MPLAPRLQRNDRALLRRHSFTEQSAAETHDCCGGVPETIEKNSSAPHFGLQTEVHDPSSDNSCTIGTIRGTHNEIHHLVLARSQQNTLNCMNRRWDILIFSATLPYGRSGDSLYCRQELVVGHGRPRARSRRPPTPSSCLRRLRGRRNRCSRLPLGA